MLSAKKTRFIWIPILVIVPVVGLIVYYLFNPGESSFFPQCPFHYLTGWDCPGCGSQRALHHLLHLNIKGAFLSNPLLISAIPYLIICVYLEYFGGKKKHPKIRKALYSKRAVLTIFILIMVFWVVRNLI